MQFDSVMLHQIWRETTRKLEAYARDVRENKNVREASEFARWLQFSGVIKILEAFPQAEPLRVDGAALRKLAHELVLDCGECFRNGKADAKYAASDIAEINRKLDLIAAHVSTISPLIPATTEAAGNPSDPVLHVYSGGASCGGVEGEEGVNHTLHPRNTESGGAREARDPFPLLSYKHLAE